MRGWAGLVFVLGCGGSEPPSPPPIHYSTPTCPDGRPWQGRPCLPPGQPLHGGLQAPPALPPHPALVGTAPPAFPIPIGVPPEPTGAAAVPSTEGRAVPVDEATRGACTEGDVHACHRVDCASGQARSCYRAGLLLSQRDAPWEGLIWLERGCDLGEAKACAELGKIHAGGGTQHVDPQNRWPPTDPSRALEVFARACALGDADSCRAEAVRFGTGERQQAMMRDQHITMCEQGPPAVMFGPGEAREPLGSSCRIAAWYFETGRGGETDAARACALDRRGCTLHDAGACEAAKRCAK